MKPDVSTVILRILSDVGVKQIFGIPGDAINGLVDAIRRQNEIEFVLMRHEESAAFAASAQAKLTGRLSVVVGTAGPGAIHLLNGLYDAKLDGAPVLAITGQVDTPFLGSDYHQEIDLDALFSDVAGYSETLVNVDQVPGIVHQAVRSALTNRTVSHIVLPSDMALATVSAEIPSLTLPTPLISRPGQEGLAEAAAMIRNAESPTLLVGIGARGAQEEVLGLGSRISAPIVSTLRAKHVIPEDHPLALGGLGLLGSNAALSAIERTDLLVMIGTDFPYGDFYPNRTKAIQIDIDPARIGRRYPVALGLTGDAAETIRCVLPLIDATPIRPHLEKAQSEMKEWRDRMHKIEVDDSTPIRPQFVARTISDTTTPGTLFLVDTGAVTVWAARHLHLKEGDLFTLSSGLASMAFGLGGSIGAQLAFPDRDVVTLIGDGGMSMLIGELMTAVSRDLPITVVVFNNSKLGLIQMEQEVAGLPEYATHLDNPSFADVAHSIGATAWRVETPEQMKPALTAAMASPKPSVIDVVVNPEEITMPPRIKADMAWGYARAKVKEALSQP